MCLRNCPAIILFLLILTGCELQNLQPNADLSSLTAVQQRANEAYQNEDWKTAEKEYHYLAKNLPSEIEPWFRLGNIYARTGKLDAAVSAYREALVRDTKNSKIWHNLGIVQLRQATNTFVEMLAYTDPNDPLNQRARHVVNTMGEMMTTGFGAGAATAE